MTAKRAGTIHFWIDDERDSIYNESTDLSYSLYVEDEEDEIVEIDRLVEYCMSFAQAMGFCEKTVMEAFGRE